jgi:primosomal protein N' (replication factor Y)
MGVIDPLFPRAKIPRLDSQKTTTKDGFCKICGTFRDRKIDLLVGTHMISKG